MGGSFKPTGDMNDKMLDSSFPHSGKQIMSVKTFLQEIEGLRRAYAQPSGKRGGPMLPNVLVHRDTPKDIQRKQRALKRSSAFHRKSGIDEFPMKYKDFMDSAPESADFSPLSLQSQNSNGNMSELSDWLSDADSLPNLSEDEDPSYTNRFFKKKTSCPLQGQGRGKKRGRPPKLKIGESIKKPCYNSGDGRLMKSARKNCLQKLKMYSNGRKDKRPRKASDENVTFRTVSHRKALAECSHISTLESLQPNTSSHYRTTQIAQLKPFAKSPKDVEKSPDPMNTLNTIYRTSKDHEVTKDPEEFRQVLKNRLATFPLKYSDAHNVNDKRKSCTDSMALDDSIDLDGNSSHETIPYDDVQPNITTSNKKMKTVIKEGNHYTEAAIVSEMVMPDITASNKKMKAVIHEGNYPQLPVATSPINFQESLIDTTDTEAAIVIEKVAGGVHDAFDSPERDVSQEVDPTLTPSNITSHLKQEKLKLQENEDRRDIVILRMKHLQDSIDDLKVELANFEHEKVTLDKDIENLTSKIKQSESLLKKHSELAKGLLEDDGTSDDIVPQNITHQEPSQQTLRQTMTKAINVIPAASMSKFGMTNPVKEVSVSDTQDRVDSSILEARLRLSNTTGYNDGKSLSIQQSIGSSDASRNSLGTGPASVFGPCGNFNKDGHKGSNLNSPGPLAPPYPSPSYQQTVRFRTVPKSRHCQGQSQMQTQISAVSNLQLLGSQMVPGTKSQPVQSYCPIRPRYHDNLSHSTPNELEQPQQQSQPQQQHNKLPADIPLFQQQSQQHPLHPQSQMPHQHPQVLQLPQIQAHPHMAGSYLQQQVAVNSLSQEKQQQEQQCQQLYFITSNNNLIQNSNLPSVNQQQSSVVFLPKSDNQQMVIFNPVSSSVGPTDASSLSSSVVTTAGNVTFTTTTANIGAKTNLAGSSRGQSSLSKSMVSNCYPVPNSKQKECLLEEPQLIPSSQSTSRVSVSYPVQPSHSKTLIPTTHLMVPSQPSVNPVKTQVKARTSNMGQSAVLQSVSHMSQDASRSPALAMLISNEETVPSPEPEKSCFLCGAPYSFVCCNNILYCSQKCKEKDWSRHQCECINKR
ncbi:hypothetical protein SK128_016710 [Halocaridina rubra]|uniref:MYND-type domain-containing protein n=1 Tax=Halocaridina rubra TaxID=373956 RepID=A0AAN8WW33_HALRR